MGGENERGESKSKCDVGLGLRMQSTESFPNKSMIVTPHLSSSSLYHNHNYKSNININNNFISSPYCESMSSDSTGDVGYGFGEGGSLYCDLSNNNNNEVACFSDLYDVVAASGEGSVQRTFLPLTNPSGSYPKSSGMRVNDNNNNKRSAFTLRQWEELERQIMICKYMMASIPVPPHLLVTLANTSTAVSTSLSIHNSTSCRLDLRYTRGGGRGNDAEPWRCRRTDGKKWRCSRDVAPYQKYCERHAHKPRPRSRKPVEQQHQQQQQQQCHITTTNATINSINNNNNSTSSLALQGQVFNIPAVVSGPTYAQPRYTEWFMKGDPIPGSSLNEQWQQLVQPSPNGLNLYDEHNRAISLFHKHYGEEHESVQTNTYACTNDDSSFQNHFNLDHQAQTRHFIDAWSCADREVEINHVSNQTTRDGKLPLSSLTLSMSGGAEVDDENGNFLLPGGPLGEALCLGISGSGKGHSNLSSSHGYSNRTSSCSKSS